MTSENRVIILGEIVNDFSLTVAGKYEDKRLVSFYVQTQVHKAARQMDGQLRELTIRETFRIIAWNNLAVAASQSFSKGSVVRIFGYLKSDSKGGHAIVAEQILTVGT